MLLMGFAAACSQQLLKSHRSPPTDSVARFLGEMAIDAVEMNRDPLDRVFFCSGRYFETVAEHLRKNIAARPGVPH